MIGLGHIILHASQSQSFLMWVYEPLRKKTFVFKVELITVVLKESSSS